MLECYVRKPLLTFAGCVGMATGWLSLLSFGKRTHKTDSG
jgi:hypothetical protein